MNLEMLEFIILFSGIMLFISYNYLSTSGTITNIIPASKEKNYHTFIVEYLYLGYFRKSSKYRSYKQKKKFQLNSGVYVYLNPYGTISMIGKRPIIQEERNIQFQIDMFRTVFIGSLGIYLYLLHQKKKSMNSY
jgi:hypothetical protein